MRHTGRFSPRSGSPPIAPAPSLSTVEAILLAAILERLRPAARRPLVVGLAGSQGSGKSTAAAGLNAGLNDRGVRSAVLSLDDLYLPRADRERLAAEVHPLLLTRGPPGTHDVRLGQQLIGRLGRRETIALPRFDKARDTRRPEAEWEVVRGPLEVLVFEGWCLGARPQPEGALEAPINSLERDEDPDGRWRRWVNDQLAGAYQALFGRLDFLAFLAAPSFEVVAAWRIEQEEALRSKLRASDADVSGLMSPHQIERFVQVYERLTRRMLHEAPGYADLTLRLDEHRGLCAAQP